MANYYYGLNVGQGEFDAQVGTSTNNTDIELFVTGANASIGREQALLAIEYFQGYLLQQPWPLAASGNMYIGLNGGQSLKDLVKGNSSNGVDIELRINTSNVSVRNDAYVALEVLEDVLLRNTFPPV